MSLDLHDTLAIDRFTAQLNKMLKDYKNRGIEVNMTALQEPPKDGDALAINVLKGQTFIIDLAGGIQNEAWDDYTTIRKAKRTSRVIKL